MRIVLDTNLLLASIARTSPYRWLFDAVLDGRVDLCVSTEILLEYEEVIGERSSPAVSANVLRAIDLLPGSVRVEPAYRWRLIGADPDDNKFVDAAVAANASAVVTQDAHFGVLARVPFPRVAVLSADQLKEFVAP